MSERNPSDKKKTSAKSKGKHPFVEVNPDKRPHEKLAEYENLFRFINSELLTEAKKKILRTKSGKPDARSPRVRSILTKDAPGGANPRIKSIRNQIADLNGNKPSVKTVPASRVRIASPPKIPGMINADHQPFDDRPMLQESKLEILKRVVLEWGDRAYAVSSNGWSSRGGKGTRPAKPANRPERLVVSSAKHAAKAAQNLAKAKIASNDMRQNYNQAKAERDQTIKQVTRLT